jgi:hypothetical protein
MEAVAEDDEFVRAMNINGMTPYLGEVEQSVPSRKIIHVKGPCGVLKI